MALSFSLHCCSSLRTLCFSPLITCRGTTPVKLTGDHPQPPRPGPPASHGDAAGPVPGLGRGPLPTPWDVPPIRSPASLLDLEQGAGGGREQGAPPPQRAPAPPHAVHSHPRDEGWDTHHLSHQARTPQAQQPRAAPSLARSPGRLDWGPGEAPLPQRFLLSAHAALWEMTPCIPDRTSLVFLNSQTLFNWILR